MGAGQLRVTHQSRRRLGQYCAHAEISLSLAIFIDAEKSVLWFAGGAVRLSPMASDGTSPGHTERCFMNNFRDDVHSSGRSVAIILAKIL
jgi:hypothetical protein